MRKRNEIYHRLENLMTRAGRIHNTLDEARAGYYAKLDTFYRPTKELMWAIDDTNKLIEALEKTTNFLREEAIKP